MTWVRLARTGIAIIVLIGLGYLATRPATVFDYGGPELAHSLKGEAGGARGVCAPVESEGSWGCTVERTAFSGMGPSYDVRSDDNGCWDARRQNEQMSGCVNLLDYLRLSDRFGLLD